MLEFGAKRVVLATGARWRRDGIGRAHTQAIPGFHLEDRIFTPDDVMDGRIVRGPVVVFDDDHYYLGGVVAEKLRAEGIEVTLVTPAERVSAWTVNTLEQHAIQKHLMELGVELITNRNLAGYDGDRVLLECVYTGRRTDIAAASIVTVTSRTPNDELAVALDAMQDAVSASGIISVTSIGDCWAPSTIAASVYAGHRYAREFDWPPGDAVAFNRELPQI